MSNHKPPIVVILGPTSSGKSEVAIRLARKFGGEIISADSRQVYRGMDVGTGKITRDKRQETRDKKRFISSGIKHHLIDVVSPRTEYNVSKFKKEAEKIIEDILSRGKLPIICGGTGFWIKAVVDDVTFPEVKPDWKLREKLNRKTALELIQELEKLDPVRAKNIDAKNKVRLIRAIEIARTLGSVPRYKIQATRYNFLQIGIDVPKEKLQNNIHKRLRNRFAAGMIAEVAKLKKSGLSWKKIQSFGLGYFWIPLYLQGKIKTREELLEKIYHAEKDYAKRQLTWFKKDARIKWLPVYRSGRKNYTPIQEEVKKFLTDNHAPA